MDPEHLSQLHDNLRRCNDETLNVLNLQPVVPIKLNAALTLLTPTIVPVVSKPTIRNRQVWGLGDITPTLFLVPNSKGARSFAVGPTFLLPTATDDVLGTGQWLAGPAAVPVYSRGPWVAAELVITVTWQRDRGQWTVPLGAGIGRIFTLGKHPMSLALEGCANVAQPSGFGDFNARLIFKLLLPTGGS